MPEYCSGCEYPTANLTHFTGDLWYCPYCWHSYYRDTGCITEQGALSAELRHFFNILEERIVAHIKGEKNENA